MYQVITTTATHLSASVSPQVTQPLHPSDASLSPALSYLSSYTLYPIRTRALQASSYLSQIKFTPTDILQDQLAENNDDYYEFYIKNIYKTYEYYAERQITQYIRLNVLRHTQPETQKRTTIIWKYVWLVFNQNSYTLRTILHGQREGNHPLVKYCHAWKSISIPVQRYVY